MEWKYGNSCIASEEKVGRRAWSELEVILYISTLYMMSQGVHRSVAVARQYRSLSTRPQPRRRVLGSTAKTSRFASGGIFQAKS